MGKVEMKRQWYYRGYLKSCNYTCSYCPFSKKKTSCKEIEKDKKEWFRFVDKVNEDESISGAVQIVPYGEALIHSYYWEGLAKLSVNKRVDLVGAQSNFSFSVEKMLAVYDAQGGKREKLRLWGTFHPELTTVDRFVQQCRRLLEAGVMFCVGAVGVPKHIETIQALREKLPQNVYLWINKMNGLGRNYTKEEKEVFLEIDEYFEMELRHHKSDVSLCGKNRFVEWDGTIRRCNICPQTIGNIYTKAIKKQKSLDGDYPEETKLDAFGGLHNAGNSGSACTRRECSCFLSYCNQNPKELLFFQPYPGFRIPTYPKAVFLDIDGTLIPPGEKRIPKEYVKGIARLAKHSKVYFATSLPYEIARQRTRDIWEFASGGVFANGALCICEKDEEEKKWEEIQKMEDFWIERVKEKAKEYQYKLYTYKRGQFLYKVTLVFYGKSRKCLTSEWARKQLIEDLKIPESFQFLLEDNCFQITQKGTGKLQGVLKICSKNNYKEEDVMVAGDSENDIPMLNYFSHAIWVKGNAMELKWGLN